jgi:hypothetical protein
MVEPCEEREKSEKCDRVRSPVRSSNLAPEGNAGAPRPHGPCRDGQALVYGRREVLVFAGFAAALSIGVTITFAVS